MQYYNMWCDQAKSVWSRSNSIFIFLTNGMHHFHRYILQKTLLKLVNWFQRYEQFKDAKNKRKQKTFSALFGSILKSIFLISDWFCLITSHIWIRGTSGQNWSCKFKHFWKHESLSQRIYELPLLTNMFDISRNCILFTKVNSQNHFWGGGRFKTPKSGPFEHNSPYKKKKKIKLTYFVAKRDLWLTWGHTRFLNYTHLFKEAQSYLFNFFFKHLEILVSQESLYFSHNPGQISQLKSVPFGRC